MKPLATFINESIVNESDLSRFGKLKNNRYISSTFWTPIRNLIKSKLSNNDINVLIGKQMPKSMQLYSSIMNSNDVQLTFAYGDSVNTFNPSKSTVFPLYLQTDKYDNSTAKKVADIDLSKTDEEIADELVMLINKHLL